MVQRRDSGRARAWSTMEPAPPPPHSEEELVRRARSLAGRRLEEVAARYGLRVPPDQRRHKGFVGQLLETALGATAGNRAEPDFPGLGVELKTLPVSPDGSVRESTFVCTAPMDGTLDVTWEASWVRHKLARVLWLPIVSDSDTPLPERVIGGAILWSPSADEDAVLRADWVDLADRLALGELGAANASHGVALQLRPKAARASDEAWMLGEDGEWVRDNPRGFYLRTSFTQRVLRARVRVG